MIGVVGHGRMGNLVKKTIDETSGVQCAGIVGSQIRQKDLIQKSAKSAWMWSLISVNPSNAWK